MFQGSSCQVRRKEGGKSILFANSASGTGVGIRRDKSLVSNHERISIQVHETSRGRSILSCNPLHDQTEIGGRVRNFSMTAMRVPLPHIFAHTHIHN